MHTIGGICKAYNLISTVFKVYWKWISCKVCNFLICFLILYMQTNFHLTVEIGEEKLFVFPFLSNADCLAKFCKTWTLATLH